MIPRPYRCLYPSLALALVLQATPCRVGGEESSRPIPAPLAVRGLHLSAPGKGELQAALRFVREELGREGVNTLIVEFGYQYDFRSRPEFADPSAMGSEEVGELAAACREAGIELIPQINCLGHQSWAERTGRLLEKHPELDETPGKYPKNEGIYCRSYCPLHPDVHPIVFDLIDELARACGAKAFHVGLDEVFILADPDCPRCRGKDPADLFAGEVRTLHEHLAKIGCKTWMWGDRLLDGKATGIGEWEASKNGTPAAIDKIPKDIVICDWHYEKAHDTPPFFAEKGFPVVACPWRKADVALEQLEKIRAIRAAADPAVAGRGLGVVQTTWCGFRAFVDAYDAAAAGKDPRRGAPGEAAACFRELFRKVRGE